MNRSGMEIRTYCREVRAAPAGEEGALRFEGYAAVFNAPSEDLGGFREVIAPGAFAHLEEDDVRCLMNHDPNYVLGRNQAGTLRLEQDATGLKFAVEAPDTTWARDLYRSVGRGDIDQCSFAFVVSPGGEIWERTTAGELRTLRDVHLVDVSIVTYPAYPDTVAAARSAQQAYRERPRSGGKAEILRKKLELKTEKGPRAHEQKEETP